MKKSSIPFLVLCLIWLCTLPGLCEVSEDGTAWLSADAADRHDYFDLIQNDAVLNIRVPEENPNFRDIDGVLFDKSGKNLLLYPNGRPDREYAVPEGVETIEEECSFGYGCQLERLILPASFRGFNGANLFRTEFSEFVVAEGNPYLKAVDGVLFSWDGKTLAAYPPGNTAERYAVPKGTERIADWAFSVNEHLIRVDMPDSLRTIGDYAFDECEKLRSVRLPEKMESLGTSAFGFCYELEEIILPEGLTDLPLQLLVSDSLSGTLRIPHTVKNIGGEALCFLPRLTDIYLPDALETIDGEYTRKNYEKCWTNPLHLIYGWNDTGLADYSVVFHAHEGTFGETLLRHYESFPYVITPAGVEAWDASAAVQALTGAMSRAGHPRAELIQNADMKWLPRRMLAAYTLHEAAAVFREDGRLLLCGFDDRDGEWALRWINEKILSSGVAPAQLSYYGEETLELIVPDQDNDDDAWQYLFGAGPNGLSLREAHLFQGAFNYDGDELLQFINDRPDQENEAAVLLRCAKPDDYDFVGYDEYDNPIVIRTPGETIRVTSVPGDSLRVESFEGLTYQPELVKKQ